MFASGSASFPFLPRVVHWILNYQFFELQGATAEGSRRLGLLAGWVLGAPISVLTLAVATDWFYDDETLFFAPIAGFAGFLLVYVSVHGLFWVIDGFRDNQN